MKAMFPFVLALFGGVLYFGKIEVAGFEKAAAADLVTRLAGDDVRVQVQAKIGPEAIWGDVARVSIEASGFEADGLPLYTEPKRSRRGVIRNLDIRLSDFRIRGLRIESLSATIPDNRFDFSLALRKRQMRLTRSGEGTGEVVVSEADLADFILLKYKFIDHCTVQIENDKIYVDGSGDFGLFKSGFSVVAKLEPLDGSKLMLTFARISFDGMLVDDARRDLMIKAINPVVDLDRDLELHGALYVEKLILEDGRMKAIGRARIPEMPNDR
jgi:hypothetical protein